MLKDGILKKSVRKGKKKPKPTWLTHKTCDPGHETMITTLKANKKK